MTYEVIMTPINDILGKFTPYLKDGKKLYEESDVRQMLELVNAQVTKKICYTHEISEVSNHEHYSEQ